MFDDDDDDDNGPFLTIEETAKLLRVNRRTLDNLRWSGDGPPARRHGGRIVYHRREVLNWSKRRHTHTPPPERANKPAPPPDSDARRQLTGDNDPTNQPPTPPMERKP